MSSEDFNRRYNEYNPDITKDVNHPCIKCNSYWYAGRHCSCQDDDICPYFKKWQDLKKQKGG